MSATAILYRMLDNESLWNAAVACHRALTSAGIPHAVCGGVAVCLHGYRRNTVDVDLLVTAGHSPQIRAAMEPAGFESFEADREFRTAGGVAVHFLAAGEPAGKGSEVRLPDPAVEGVVETIDGLPVLKLARLIESKLASGEGSLRRTHRDFADVVELISIHRLNQSFASHLHKSLRKLFQELIRHATDS